jgi:4-amino-4-deoxy-L-arabinose transferase-like glycosyltransferase
MLVAFYVATGLAFLAKGPAGLIPLAVALVWRLVAHGWRGAPGLLSLPGLLALGLLTVSWLLLAFQTGGDDFVQSVLVQDYQSSYFGSGGPLWQRVTHPFRLAVGHLLPWVILLPLASWAALREPDPERARRSRLLIVWAVTTFVLIAISGRQRWRYYLPLVPPVALLVAAWYHRRPARRATTIAAVACLCLVVVTLGFRVRSEARKRQQLTAIHDVVRELRSAGAPAYALDSPDIVFDYYANHPVVPLAEFAPFERAPDGAYLIASEAAARAAPASLTRLDMEVRVNGQRFVLFRK